MGEQLRDFRCQFTIVLHNLFFHATTNISTAGLSIGPSGVVLSYKGSLGRDQHEPIKNT